MTRPVNSGVKLNAIMKLNVKTILASLLFLAAGAANAQSFSCITGSTGYGANAVGCTTQGESLLSWSFTGNKLTIFNNDVNPGSFITGISFDYVKPGMDVALAASQMAGVSYVMTTTDVANIPNSFNWTVDEGAEKTGNGNSNAIQGGEHIVFDLTGVSLANIGNTFKFGVHLQGLPGSPERSEKLVAVTPVPEPETYAMMLAGLGLMGAIVRRRKSKPT